MQSTYPSPMRSRLRYYPADGGTPPDPLAGETFITRWQSQYAEGIPLGFYADAAGTIPVVDDFTPVVSWKDELSTSGQLAVQLDPDKQALLVFVDGVPTLEFDGIDDFYEHTASLTAPCTIYVVSKYSGVGGSRTAIAFDGQGQNLYANLGGTWASWMQATVSSDVANTTYQVLTLTVRAANDIDLDTDGASVTKTNGAAFDTSFGPVIGADANSGINPMAGNICAILAQQSAPNEALVKAYLTTLHTTILGT